MTQHICGTCRYFEEGGFAASGRCNHPARREIRMMVLVRKNELACRENWGGGLWEPREPAEPAAISNVPPSTLVAEAPTSDHLREQYTDRVTSVGVAPVNRTPVEAVPAAEQSGKRDTISPAAAQPIERVAPIAERLITGTGSDSSTSATAMRRESWSEPQSEEQHIQSTERRTEEPPRPGRAVDPMSPPPARTPRLADDTFGRSWGAPRAFNEDQIRPVTPRQRDMEKRPPIPEEPYPGRGRPRDERSSSIEDLSHLLNRPTSDGAASGAPRHDPDIQRFGAKHPTGSVPPKRVDDLPLSGGRRGWTEPFETTNESPKHAAEMPVTPRVEHEPAARPQDNHPPQQERAKAALNPKLADIPQCCGTCRDFRPAEGGERGWCNNPYAFDHRRMVRKNDLACRSSIGDWWIPSDDWWQQQADYSHHGRPTPIVDDLLRQLLETRANGTNARNNGRG